MMGLTTPEIAMLPVLVEEARIPQAGQLPAELRPLFETWTVRKVTEDGWEDDARRLIAELAAATHLSLKPDTDVLLRDVAAAQQRVTELEEMRHLQSEQVERLRGTVEQLTHKLSGAPDSEREALADVFAALARGDSSAAEDTFEREYEEQHRPAGKAHKIQAKAARNVANLALLRDVRKAVSFYRKALEAEPGHAETARLLGRALILQGDLNAAAEALAEALRIATRNHNARGEIAARMGMGDILMAKGAFTSANAAYTSALNLIEQRLASDSTNIDLQRNLTISQNKIADVLRAQGDGPGALDACRKSLTIVEALATSDPTNTRLQYDLSGGHYRFAEELRLQGHYRDALQAYRKSLAIREELAARDPANTLWQRSLATCHGQIGNVLWNLGYRAEALDAYQNSLNIHQALAGRDPTNTLWQRGLSIDHGKIGNVLWALGDRQGALGAYNRSLSVRQTLAECDPANAQWQRDLSISHSRVADVLRALGDKQGAFDAYRNSIAILEPLIARNPADARCRRDLTVMQGKLSQLTGEMAPVETHHIAIQFGVDKDSNGELVDAEPVDAYFFTGQDLDDDLIWVTGELQPPIING